MGMTRWSSRSGAGIDANSRARISQTNASGCRIDAPSGTSGAALPGALADWITQCLDDGLEVFDHADIYGDGECERLFGRALRATPHLKHKVKLISKAGIVLKHQDTSPWRSKHYRAEAGYISAAIDASLQRLQVDQLHTFLIHRPDPLLEAPALARVLEQAVESGKVGHIGVSNFCRSNGDGYNRTPISRWSATSPNCLLATRNHSSMVAWKPCCLTGYAGLPGHRWPAASCRNAFQSNCLPTLNGKPVSVRRGWPSHGFGNCPAHRFR